MAELAPAARLDTSSVERPKDGQPSEEWSSEGRSSDGRSSDGRLSEGRPADAYKAPRPMPAARLLEVWEWGLGQPPAQRGLALLAAAYPESDPAGLAALSLGQRDEALLRLRETIFGPRLASTAACPQCGQRVEMEFTAAELRAGLPEGSPGPWQVLAGGWAVSYRLPTSADLLALPGGASLEDARQALLQRCLVEARRIEARRTGSSSTARTPEALEAAAGSPEVAAAVLEGMAQADPLADIQVDLLCPACAHSWQAPFDPLEFFWAEIEHWAVRTLQEVHTLAAAYGWGEAEILALSPLRRGLYLRMARGEI